MRRYQSAVIPKASGSEDLVQLRYAVQGTLATARSLKFIDDVEFEGISNTTIEAMPHEMMTRIAELCSQILQVLVEESRQRSGL
jgi:hypothetical protein